KPFVLAGLDAVHEDVLGESHWHFGIDAGGGLLVPTSFHGLALRAEGRLQYQFNDQSVASESSLLDWRVGVGIQVPLYFLADKMGKTAAAPECGVAVVSPEGARPDCGVDSDHDGVPDAADQCPGTTAGTPVDAHGCPAGEAALMRNIQFRLDSAELTEDSKKILDGVAATLKQPESANINVEIGGHTDTTGSDPYNQMLSQQRAESVKQYLIGKGVTAERLKTRGYGKAEPVADNTTEQGREENRRVAFRILVD
ncbi:MAG TPA: OmpA family protein, partial [Nevskiaceae bacterium]|nr:OmpA family protein [Nevskiaceae bacterium]